LERRVPYCESKRVAELGCGDNSGEKGRDDLRGKELGLHANVGDGMFFASKLSLFCTE
jgi:hypothetical protein